MLKNYEGGLLPELLPSGPASADSVSRKLYVSTRALQRRLKQEGQSFQAVLNSAARPLSRTLDGTVIRGQDGFGEACSPTIANVVDHIRYIQCANLSNPILLSAEGHVFDGLHRLAKCLLEGVHTIRCQQFEANPEPFEIVDFEVFREERPLIADTLAWMETHKL